VGLGLSLAYFGVFLAFVYGLDLEQRLDVGGDGPWRNSFLWDNVVSALLVGCFPTMTAIALKGTLRDLAELRPVLCRTAAQYDAVLADALYLDRRNRRRVCLAVIATYAAIIAAGFGSDRLGDFERSLGLMPMLWTMARITLILWLGFSAAYFSGATIRAFARLGAEQVEIDLFDLRPLAPFSRHGLRTALLWILSFSVFSLFGLTLQSGAGDLIGMSAILAFTGACLFLPVLGIRRRIRAQKSAELDRIRAALRRERGTASQAGDPVSLANRIGNLLAYERRIEQVREWPFDASTLARAGLYAALGIGSWFGAAVVERLLGLALD
jgi:hypothetical protein